MQKYIIELDNNFYLLPAEINMQEAYRVATILSKASCVNQRPNRSPEVVVRNGIWPVAQARLIITDEVRVTKQKPPFWVLFGEKMRGLLGAHDAVGGR